MGDTFIESYFDVEGKARWRLFVITNGKKDIRVRGTDTFETLDQAEQDALRWFGHRWTFTACKN